MAYPIWNCLCVGASRVENRAEFTQQAGKRVQTVSVGRLYRVVALVILGGRCIVLPGIGPTCLTSRPLDTRPFLTCCGTHNGQVDPATCGRCGHSPISTCMMSATPNHRGTVSGNRPHHFAFCVQDYNRHARNDQRHPLCSRTFWAGQTRYVGFHCNRRYGLDDDDKHSYVSSSRSLSPQESLR